MRTWSRGRSTGVWVGAIAAALIAGGLGGGLFAGQGTVAAAGPTVSIQPGNETLLCGVVTPCPAPTLNPATVSSQAGQTVTFVNQVNAQCTLKFSNGSTLAVGSGGGTASASFSQPVSYIAKCTSRMDSQPGTIAVVTPATPAPTPGPGSPSTTTVAPGSAAGAGTAKPRIVAAATTATPKPGAVTAPGPAGSSELPPVTATPTPDASLDPSALPAISAPTAAPKPKTTVANTSNTSTRTKAFYIAGGLVFAAVAIGAAAFYGIRRWRRRSIGGPGDEGAYLI